MGDRHAKGVCSKCDGKTSRADHALCRSCYETGYTKTFCADCGAPKDNGRTRCMECRRKARQWSDEQARAALLGWADTNKVMRGPTVKEWNAFSKGGRAPSVAYLVKRYGTWGAAAEAVGLVPNEKHMSREFREQRGYKTHPAFSRSRQMVTGQDLRDTRPGTIKHFGIVPSND